MESILLTLETRKIMAQGLLAEIAERNDLGFNLMVDRFATHAQLHVHNETNYSVVIKSGKRLLLATYCNAEIAMSGVMSH